MLVTLGVSRWCSENGNCQLIKLQNRSTITHLKSTTPALAVDLLLKWQRKREGVRLLAPQNVHNIVWWSDYSHQKKPATITTNERSSQVEASGTKPKLSELQVSLMPQTAGLFSTFSSGTNDE